MAKIQFSGNSINAYENLKHQYANGKLATSFTKGTGKSGGQLWEDYASNDMLDSLVSVYMNSDKLGSIDSFESKYSDYDYMDTNTRIAAASTELYADRETLNTYERYKTDEDGNYIQKEDGTYETEEYEDTEYNYYKSYLDSQAEYQKELYLATYKEKIEKEGNGFTQFFATFTVSPFLNFVSSTLSAFLNIPQLLGATFNSKIGTADYGEEFRSIMAEEWNPLAEMVADFDAKYTWLTDEYGDYNVLGEITLGVSNTLGMMMPSLAGQGIASGISAIAGISSLSPTAANVLSNVAKVGSKIASMSYWVTMGVSTLQDYCRDENLQSVNVGVLVAMAAATTTYEALVTKGMTAIFGGTQIDKMLFGSSTTGIASTLAGKITGEGGFKTAARTMIRIAVDGLKEGIEEVLQEAGTAMINNIATLYNEGFSTYGQFTGKQFGMAIGVSFLTTFITSGVSIVNNSIFGDLYTNTVVTDKNGNVKVDSKGNIKYKKMSWIDATDYKQAMSDLGTTMNKLSNMAKNKDLSAKDKLKITAAVDDVTHMVEAIGEFYNANADDIANVLKIVDRLREVSSSKGKTTEYYTSKTVTNEIKDVFTENDDKFGTVNTKKGEQSLIYAVNNVVKIKNGYRVENADGTSTEYRRFKNGGYSVTHLPDYATIAQNILEELGILQTKGKQAGLEAVATKQKLADAQVTKATAINKDSIDQDLKNAGIQDTDIKSMKDKLSDMINNEDTDSDTADSDLRNVKEQSYAFDFDSNGEKEVRQTSRKVKDLYDVTKVNTVVVTNGNSGSSMISNGVLYIPESDLNNTVQQILNDLGTNNIMYGLSARNKFSYSLNEMYKIYCQVYGLDNTFKEFLAALIINDDDLYYKMFIELSYQNNAFALVTLINLSTYIKSFTGSTNIEQQMAEKIAEDVETNIQNALTKAAPNMSNFKTLSTTLASYLTDEQQVKYQNAYTETKSLKLFSVIRLLQIELSRLNGKSKSAAISVLQNVTLQDVELMRESLRNSEVQKQLNNYEKDRLNKAVDTLEQYVKSSTMDLADSLISQTASFDRISKLLYNMDQYYTHRGILRPEVCMEDILLNDFLFTLTDDADEINSLLADFKNLSQATDYAAMQDFAKRIMSTKVGKQILDTFNQGYSMLRLYGKWPTDDRARLVLAQFVSYSMNLSTATPANVEQFLTDDVFYTDNNNEQQINAEFVENAVAAFLVTNFGIYTDENYSLEIDIDGELSAKSTHTTITDGSLSCGTSIIDLNYVKFNTTNVKHNKENEFLLTILRDDLSPIVKAGLSINQVIENPEVLSINAQNYIRNKFGDLNSASVLVFLEDQIAEYNRYNDNRDVYSLSITETGRYVLVNCVKSSELFTDGGNKLLSALHQAYQDTHNPNIPTHKVRSTITNVLDAEGISYKVSRGKFEAGLHETDVIEIPISELIKADIFPATMSKAKFILYLTPVNEQGPTAGSASPATHAVEINGLRADHLFTILHELQHFYQQAYGRYGGSGYGGVTHQFIDLTNKTEFNKFVTFANEICDEFGDAYVNFLQNIGESDSLIARLSFAKLVLYHENNGEREARGITAVLYLYSNESQKNYHCGFYRYLFPVLNALNSDGSQYIITTPAGNTYRFTVTKRKKRSLQDVNNIAVSQVGPYYSSKGIVIPTTSTNPRLEHYFDTPTSINSPSKSLSVVSRSMSTDNNSEWTAKNRYVTVKDTMNTNLRYYAFKDGIINDNNAYLDENNKRIAIQMDPHLQNFIVNSDLNLLDPELAELIQKGKLTYSHSEVDANGKYSIMQYIHDADNINDYTFKQITKYIFPDSKVKDFKTLQEFTDSYSASKNYAVLMVMRQVLEMDMDTIVDLSKGSGKGYVVLDKLYNTIAASEKFKPILEKYEIAYTQWSNKYDVSENFNQNDLRMFILQNFDGTAGSLLAQYGIERWLMVHNFQSKRSKLQTTSMDKENQADTKKNDTATNMHEILADKGTLNQEDNILDILDGVSDDDMIRQIAEAMFVEELAKGKYKDLTVSQKQTKLNKGIQNLEDMYESGKISQTRLQNMYIAKVWNMLNISQTSTIADIESGKISVITDDVKDRNAVYIRSDKNIRDNIRNHVNRNITPYINASNVGEFKTKYPDIPLVATVNEEGVARYQLDKSVWQGKSSEELKALEQRVKNAGTEMRIEAANNKVSKQLYNKIKRQLDKSNERLKRTQDKLANNKKTKTVKIKTNVEYDYEFEIASNVMMPDALRNMLNKQMSDVNFAKTDVKNISSEDSEHAVQSATKILESIEEDLSNLTDQDIADIVDYFTESVVLKVNLATTEGKDALNRYWATETVILTYLISEHRKGNITLTEDQLSRAETVLENTQRLFGTGLVVWRDALHKLDPARIRNERIQKSIKIDISETAMDELSNAMNLEPGKVYSETQLRRLVGDGVVDTIKLSYIPDTVSVDDMRTELLNYYTEKLNKIIEQAKTATDAETKNNLKEEATKLRNQANSVKTSTNDRIYNMYSVMSTEIHSEYALTKDQKQLIVSRVMRNIQNEVLEGYKGLGKKGKQKLVDKIVDWERMMMLSSPGTWVRNWVSNNIVTVTNRAGSMLGSMFNKKFMRKAYNKNEAYMIDNMVNTSEAIELDIKDTQTQLTQTQNELDNELKRLNSEVSSKRKSLTVAKGKLSSDMDFKQKALKNNTYKGEVDNRIEKTTAQIEQINNDLDALIKEILTTTKTYEAKIAELKAHLTEIRARRTETVQGLDIAIKEAADELSVLRAMKKEDREKANLSDESYKQQVKEQSDKISELKSKRDNLMKKKQYRITGTKVDSDTHSKVNDLFNGSFYTRVDEDGNEDSISFYDAIADGLSRYSDRTYNPLKGNSEAAGDQVVELIVNTMTAKIFNDNRFTSRSDIKLLQKIGVAENFMNRMIFKVLSDDPWIKKRTAYLYERMITELGLDTDNLYTRASLQCFADAYVYASWEYMHRQNMFTKLEQFIHEKNSAFYFLYKQFVPFASASWNWCMEAINYTPIGLAKGIYKILNFEKQVNKMSEQKMYGSVDVSSNFTLYDAQKTLGKGILGTLMFTMGAFAAGFGLMAIDDEDDTIKLRFSDSFYIDITNLFGTSGFLLGATMVSGIQDAMANGMSFNKFWSILGQMTTSLLEDTIFNSMFEAAAYNDTFGDYFLDTIVESFGKLIPNIWKVFSQIVNSGVETKYESGILGSLEYLVNQIIPGIAYALPKKYDIWTGELQHDNPVPALTTAINKLLPINLDIYSRSEAEVLAKSLGLSKSQLTGNYDDIGKLNTAQVAQLNKMYGQLNAQYLEDFVNNKTKYKVQTENGTYKTLSYSQMTSEQIKNVINRIMTNDASYAKIYVYTNYMNGKYYASEDTYTILKKLGISKNVYRETTKYSGFV